jgi:hypothetical protein
MTLRRLNFLIGILVAGLWLSACTAPAQPDQQAIPTQTRPQQINPPPTMSPTAVFFAPTPAQMLGALVTPTEAPRSLPPTLVPPTPTAIPQKPAFDSFVESLKNDNPNQIVGVYIHNVLALRVVQQPFDNPGYVSIVDNQITQFRTAQDIAGNIGLLAHNYLSGAAFFNIRLGDIVEIVYGDGNILEFEVVEIKEYQALTPSSPYSDFVDLRTGQTMNATSLFYEVYGGDYRVTLQTCINRDNNSEWGRIFIIAKPL